MFPSFLLFFDNSDKDLIFNAESSVCFLDFMGLLKFQSFLLFVLLLF